MAVNVSRTTISVATKIMDAGVARAKRLGYDSFSAYISYLIQRDVTERPQHVHIMDEPENALHPKAGPKYAPPLLVAEKTEPATEVFHHTLTPDESPADVKSPSEPPK